MHFGLLIETNWTEVRFSIGPNRSGGPVFDQIQSVRRSGFDNYGLDLGPDHF